METVAGLVSDGGNRGSDTCRELTRETALEEDGSSVAGE